MILTSSKNGETMSKYIELCGIYDKARKEYFDAFNECAEKLTVLFNKYCEHLGVQPTSGVIGLVPDKQNYQEGVDLKPNGAIHLDSDGFWQSCLVLKLTPHGELNTQPAEVLSFALKFKKEGAASMLYLGNHEEGFNLETTNYTEIFKYIESFITELYSNRLNQFLQSEPNERRIGFMT